MTKYYVAQGKSVICGKKGIQDEGTDITSQIDETQAKRLLERKVITTDAPAKVKDAEAAAKLENSQPEKKQAQKPQTDK